LFLSWVENTQLKQGSVWFERTCIFSGIQFTEPFIEFVFVEKDQLFGSNSNVILTQQTCGQRSSIMLMMAVESKRGALPFSINSEDFNLA